MDQPYVLEHEVRADFERAMTWATFGMLMAMITRRPNTLRPFHEARRDHAAVTEVYRGARVVEIRRIVGSTDRAGDFDREFRPRDQATANRWQSVARAHYQGVALPPVQLYQLGDEYYVRDGHHRVSVARAMGGAFIDADVVEVVGSKQPTHLTIPAVNANRTTGRVGGARHGWSWLRPTALGPAMRAMFGVGRMGRISALTAGSGQTECSA